MSIFSPLFNFLKRIFKREKKPDMFSEFADSKPNPEYANLSDDEIAKRIQAKINGDWVSAAQKTERAAIEQLVEKEVVEQLIVKEA